MGHDKTSMNVTPLLGISEPSLLLESLDQRIAFLRHQIEVGPSRGSIGHFAAATLYYGAVLDSLVRQREELAIVFAKVIAFQGPDDVVVTRQEKAL